MIDSVIPFYEDKQKIFDNGLRLVHNEDTSTQMVALNIVYDVCL